MKGKPEVIEALNKLLSHELAAANQYLAHYTALENWGYLALAALVKDRANEEREHADELVARILELEGIPAVATVGEISFTVGDLLTALTFDANAEQRAITTYNAAVKLSADAGDNATRALLEHILAEEVEHLAEIESWQGQIAVMGIGPFLSARVNKG
jgi:bacterioferritin